MLPTDFRLWREAFRQTPPEDVARVLAGAFGGVHGVTALIVHGSLGRGEFTCIDGPEGPLPVSDVEAVAVIQPGWRSKGTRSVIRARVHGALEAYGGSSPFFSLDYSVMTPRRLGMLPPWFITHEKRFGSTVVGDESVLSLIPRVTADTIDLRESNETIVWRLLHLLLHLPAALVEGRSLTTARERVWAYVCHRNILDFTTWIAPHLGILEVGFGGRVPEIVAHPQWRDLERTFGPDLGDVLADALLWKSHPNDAEDPVSAPYERVISMLATAFQLINLPSDARSVLYGGQHRTGGPFLDLPNPRRLWTVARQRPWRLTGTGGRPPVRWTMAELGKRVIDLHHSALMATTGRRSWSRRVEALLWDLEGFLPGTERRVGYFRGLQRWWEETDG